MPLPTSKLLWKYVYSLFASFKIIRRPSIIVSTRCKRCNKENFQSVLQGDQKVSVHLTITVQSSGAPRLFDHPVLNHCFIW
jgi:hypothetical protein